MSHWLLMRNVTDRHLPCKISYLAIGSPYIVVQCVFNVNCVCRVCCKLYLILVLSTSAKRAVWCWWCKGMFKLSIHPPAILTPATVRTGSVSRPQYCIYILFALHRTSRQLWFSFGHHHHHHIYFRLPERSQKPIELATIKRQNENCKKQKIQKSNKKKILKMYINAARPREIGIHAFHCIVSESAL